MQSRFYNVSRTQYYARMASQRPLHVQPLALAIIFIFLNKITSGTVVTINKYPGWGYQRPCAVNCFYSGNKADLLGLVGCPYGVEQNLHNECYCRPDLVPTGVSWLSKCVMSSCTSNTVDRDSAVSIYTNYCETALAEGVTTTTTSSSLSLARTTSSLAVATSTSSSRSTSLSRPATTSWPAPSAVESE
jgi:hypothetical protein